MAVHSLYALLIVERILASPWTGPLFALSESYREVFMKLLFRGTLLGCLMMAAACASHRPILDENRKFQKVGESRAEKDIDMCMSKADKYLEKHNKARLNRSVKRQAVGGAVVGGLFGALSGKGVGGAVGGAALGAGIGASGAYASRNGPDPLKQNYVNNCLQRQSYVVLGWTD